ncbi:unnamed protein product [Thelazia callipaeda]|uniref:Dihydrolipoamide acetyltransferase component of pyruvate dehydrogenase complex n=1 Tax=Thelazia callipaeda TaxID=103827 RepID=A0A3P7N7W7_THECL|nr:unnamed protein product [Thelazia callipaeda]
MLTNLFSCILARWLPIVQFRLSDIGEGIAQVQIKEWHVKEGDHVAQFDNICEVQSDKASATITSRYDGIIKKLHYNIEDIAKVGTTLVDIEVVDEHGNVHSDVQEEILEDVKENVACTKGAQESGKILATPAVRHFAELKGVNLRDVSGTGSDGRILKDDIIQFYESQKGRFNSCFGVLEDDKIVPIRGYTRTMIKSMTEALKIPHFSLYEEINFDQLIAMKEELKKFEGMYSARMTFMPIIIKAVSLALNKFPKLNAVTDEYLENIIYKAFKNISIAMDTPEGLVVPNIKNCERRTIWDIAQELDRLKKASSQMKIASEDLKDGTFTLSNVGMIGGTYLNAIIMPPQLAIGAIGQISKLPRFDKDGKVYAANVAYFSWAADHRVVDGATLARFSSQVKQYLENPYSMLADYE